METKKLYYLDSHKTRFSATVLACRETQGKYCVVLDATAFYPEGGGQAGDTGTLGNVRVTDTRELDGQLVHLCDGPLPEGQTVTGEIDWLPRFIRMQQHSGEHILSGILFRKYGCHNTGFHMNLQQMQVDFDGVIPQEDLPGLEREANEAIWKNLPVSCYVPDEKTLPTIPYRTKRALPWPVRIVEIPGYDICACCGTHVASTGEIGILKIYSAVPFRGGTRLEMACGIPAYDALCRITEENRRVSQCLSVPVTETGAGARRLAQQLEEARYTITDLRRKHYDAVAAALRGRGDTVYFTEEAGGGELRELCLAIAVSCGGTAAVLGAGGSYCLAGQEVRPLAKRLNERFSGRGGGKPGCCQGKINASREEAAAFFGEMGFTQG